MKHGANVIECKQIWKATRRSECGPTGREPTPACSDPRANYCKQQISELRKTVHLARGNLFCKTQIVLKPDVDLT